MPNNKAFVIIPARYASSRYPGKPLVPICGKSLLFRTWSIAKAVACVDDVFIATDDPRVFEHAESFGAKAIMTPIECRNGTERLCAALDLMVDDKPEIVVNLQGDAVLTPPWVIQALVDKMKKDSGIQIATPAVQLNQSQFEMLCRAKQQKPASGTLVTFNKKFEAMYFSKAVIPFLRDQENTCPVYRHIGLYAYRNKALEQYLHYDEGVFEKAEGLEQLRALENGMDIKVVLVDYQGRTHWSVDSPEDVAKVESIIEKEGELVS